MTVQCSAGQWTLPELGWEVGDHPGGQVGLGPASMEAPPFWAWPWASEGWEATELVFVAWASVGGGWVVVALWAAEVVLVPWASWVGVQSQP